MQKILDDVEKTLGEVDSHKSSSKIPSRKSDDAIRKAYFSSSSSSQVVVIDVCWCDLRSAISCYICKCIYLLRECLCEQISHGSSALISSLISA
jgi:hypothetical protein